MRFAAVPGADCDKAGPPQRDCNVWLYDEPELVSDESHSDSRLNFFFFFLKRELGLSKMFA